VFAEPSPHVVVHVAVSLDGASAGFEPDVAMFYELAKAFDEDVTLAGADTILAQEEVLAAVARPGPTEGAPLLAVVDGRERVSQWDALRDCGRWSGVTALRAEGSGDGRVDLGKALAPLAADGAHTVRVDSGGGLNGALLERGLVDEISLLVHPCLVGDGGSPWHGASPPPSAALTPIANERIQGDLVWLRYRVAKER
jgi:2,5-diamino-6-(ribosylamino)-4(3H)-pyrimidinone 5'-phosphate reductase